MRNREQPEAQALIVTAEAEGCLPALPHMLPRAQFPQIPEALASLATHCRGAPPPPSFISLPPPLLKSGAFIQRGHSLCLPVFMCPSRASAAIAVSPHHCLLQAVITQSSWTPS